LKNQNSTGSGGNDDKEARLQPPRQLWRMSGASDNVMSSSEEE